MADSVVYRHDISLWFFGLGFRSSQWQILGRISCGRVGRQWQILYCIVRSVPFIIVQVLGLLVADFRSS